jgi:hypothetical protein
VKWRSAPGAALVLDSVEEKYNTLGPQPSTPKVRINRHSQAYVWRFKSEMRKRRKLNFKTIPTDTMEAAIPCKTRD